MRVVEQEGERPVRRVGLQRAEEPADVEVGGGDGTPPDEIGITGEADDVAALVPLRDDARDDLPREKAVEVVEDREGVRKPLHRPPEEVSDHLE